jgi:hypothetical protein
MEKEKNAILITSVGVLLFCLYLYVDQQTDIPTTIFVVAYIVSPLYFIFYFFACILSGIHIFVQRFAPRSFIPLTVLVIGILLKYAGGKYSDHRKLNLEKRKEVIQLIKEKKLSLYYGSVDLPAEYQSLSSSQLIPIHFGEDSTFTVEFFYESFYNSYTTLHYTNDPVKLQEYEEQRQQSTRCEKVDEGWYFMYHR